MREEREERGRRGILIDGGGGGGGNTYEMGRLWSDCFGNRCVWGVTTLG